MKKVFLLFIILIVSFGLVYLFPNEIIYFDEYIHFHEIDSVTYNKVPNSNAVTAQLSIKLSRSKILINNVKGFVVINNETYGLAGNAIENGNRIRVILMKNNEMCFQFLFNEDFSEFMLLPIGDENYLLYGSMDATAEIDRLRIEEFLT